VLLATPVNSTAAVGLVRVVLYVDSSFSMSDVPVSDAAPFITSCESSRNLFRGAGCLLGLCEFAVSNVTDDFWCEKYVMQQLDRLFNFFQLYLFIAALHCRCGHYIFDLFLLSVFLSFFFSPNLSGRRLDVCHTSTHDVVLV